MVFSKFSDNSRGAHIIQHVLFVLLSFFILLNIFKSSSPPSRVDYVYTALFLGTILPVVYLHLYWLLAKLDRKNSLIVYIFPLLLISAFFIWINARLFDHWSVKLFPGFFFISYYKWWEIASFFLVFICVTALLKLSKSWFVVNSLQRQLLETDKQRVQAELKALKAQVNPHFFFNTLNSIYSMSLDKDERLPGTILQLSELMRYFLYESREDLVPLSKEIHVLKDYIALQKIRSDERLEITAEMEEHPGELKIAPLLLITFVENAFKHGAKGSTGKAFIKIKLTTAQNTINFRVENNIGVVDKAGKDDPGGLGLDNVKRRLELIYPQRHKLLIENSDQIFLVHLQLQL
jgi:sensor histidine kinase YesM